MSHLEPSYLRYIFDGLQKGDLHPDNTAALPEGLIGMYDEAFDESKPVRERQKLLHIFAIWALLKKEVSAQFVAEILVVPTQEIIDFIATYSSWFTSPESGKYQLYHERLKVYLLQKLSEKEIATLHNKLITRLEQAIAKQKEDEFELYGLEFLSVHYFTTSMLTGDGKKIIALSYDQNLWQRQLKLSKGFEWTKKGLKQAMNWASKYNDEEVIECGLQMVDLHHQEQKDASLILELVVEGDIEAVLKRIESFGGNDKEGLQRKFILYMLCLMELTLFESNNRPFRKEFIEKILKHFDENISLDHSLLNWDSFFPSYTMFLIAYECALLDLDYLILFKRTDSWKKDWLNDKAPFNDLQFEVLKKCADIISYDIGKSIALAEISTELIKQSKIDEGTASMKEAQLFADGMKNDIDKFNVFSTISIELAKQGKVEEALELCKKINNNYSKSILLSVISSEFNKLKKNETASSIIEEAIDLINGINDEYERISALVVLSSELFIQGKFEYADLMINKAIEYARYINEDFFMTSVHVKISTGLVKQGKIEEAMKYAQGISIDFHKILALIEISTELFKQMKFEEANSVMQKAIEFTRGINFMKNSTFYKIVINLSKQGKQYEVANMLQELLLISTEINDAFDNNHTIKEITNYLTEQGKIEEAIKMASFINDEINKISAFVKISSQLFNGGKILQAESEINKALDFARILVDNSDKSRMLNLISSELALQGKSEVAFYVIQEAYNNAKIISDISNKSSELTLISSEFLKQNELEKSLSVMQEALECANSLIELSDKSNALNTISIELFKQGKIDKASSVIDESIECARGISMEFEKVFYLTAISTELFKQNRIEKAEVIMKESLEIVESINNDFFKSISLMHISTNLCKQKKMTLAEEYGMKIPLSFYRYDCWHSISINSYQVENWCQAISIAHSFQNEEPKEYYLKGLAENIKLNESDKQNILNSYFYFINDIESLEKIFQQHAINQLFFENLPQNKIQRYNRTLNIQWAIDIKNQLYT